MRANSISHSLRNSIHRLRPLAIAALLLAPAIASAAADVGIEPQHAAGTETWHAKTLLGALGLVALFGIFGIVLAVLGYKIFDFCTPGNLHKEIVENKNVAAAIVGAAVILGVCIIIAASIMG
jgi:putative membrane protein